MRPFSTTCFFLSVVAFALNPSSSRAQLSGTVATKGQVYTTPILQKTLDDMGYEPEESSKDIFRITIERDNWKIPIRLYILKDTNFIWLDATLAKIENPEIVPPLSLVKLLKENEKIGPAHFALHSTDSYLHMYEAFENRNLTQAMLRKRIDGFDATVRKTYEIWKPDNFKSTGASIPQVEPMDPPVGNNLAREKEKFRGTWRVTKIVTAGKTMEGDELDGQAMVLDFAINGDVTVKRTGATSDSAKWVINPAATPRTIDITNREGKLEKGIFRFDGNTLTICFASPGGDRPTRFDAPEGFSGGLLVMTKEQ